MSKIEIKNLSFSYGENTDQFTALEDINLSIEGGEFICLLGPSGCGKSTLLSLLEGLNRADSGQILMDGKIVTGPGRNRAVVFQHYSLFPWLSARKNVLFGIRQSGQVYPPKKARAIADDYLAKANLTYSVDEGAFFVYQDYPDADVNSIIGPNHLDPISGFPGYRSVRCRIYKPEEDAQ